jgi:hypothetical protein
MVAESIDIDQHQFTTCVCTDVYVRGMVAESIDIDQHQFTTCVHGVCVALVRVEIPYCSYFGPTCM